MKNMAALHFIPRINASRLSFEDVMESLKQHINSISEKTNEAENSEIYPENILQNIAEDLNTINGTCTEIKESQLNCATADELNNMSTTITLSVTDKVDEMQTSIENQTQTVSEIGNNLTTSVDNLKTEVSNKNSNFTANPPVQKIEKTIHIAPESWQAYLAMFISVFIFF